MNRDAPHSFSVADLVGAGFSPPLSGLILPAFRGATSWVWSGGYSDPFFHSSCWPGFGPRAQSAAGASHLDSCVSNGLQPVPLWPEPPSASFRAKRGVSRRPNPAGQRRVRFCPCSRRIGSSARNFPIEPRSTGTRKQPRGQAQLPTHATKPCIFNGGKPQGTKNKNAPANARAHFSTSASLADFKI